MADFSGSLAKLRRDANEWAITRTDNIHIIRWLLDETTIQKVICNATDSFSLKFVLQSLSPVITPRILRWLCSKPNAVECIVSNDPLCQLLYALPVKELREIVGTQGVAYSEFAPVINATKPWVVNNIHNWQIAYTLRGLAAYKEALAGGRCCVCTLVIARSVCNIPRFVRLLRIARDTKEYCDGCYDRVNALRGCRDGCYDRFNTLLDMPIAARLPDGPTSMLMDIYDDLHHRCTVILQPEFLLHHAGLRTIVLRQYKRFKKHQVSDLLRRSGALFGAIPEDKLREITDYHGISVEFELLNNVYFMFS